MSWYAYFILPPGLETFLTVGLGDVGVLWLQSQGPLCTGHMVSVSHASCVLSTLCS